MALPVSMLPAMQLPRKGHISSFRDTLTPQGRAEIGHMQKGPTGSMYCGYRGASNPAQCIAGDR